MKDNVESKPVVVLGPRVYMGNTWKRRDAIYIEKVLIGYIHLSLEDRMGFTVSLRSQLTQQGRAIMWCVEQSSFNLLRPNQQKRTFDVKENRTSRSRNNIHF
jgi:hypothetical protein